MATAPWVQATRPIDPAAVLGPDNPQTHTNAPAMQAGDADAGGIVRPARHGPDAPANVTMRVIDGIVMGNTVSHSFSPPHLLTLEISIVLLKTVVVFWLTPSVDHSVLSMNI